MLYKINIYTLIFATIMLSTSCSVIKKRQSAQPQSQVSVTLSGEPTITTDNVPDQGELLERESRRGRRQNWEYEQEQQRANMAAIEAATKVRPTIMFSSTEAQHVKMSQSINNPFPESGEIVLDLDKWAKEFHYPLDGKLISKYGMRGRRMHTGTDIKSFASDTIRAAMPGVVRMSKPYSGYGNIVVIRHYDGFETVYSHNLKNLVSVNDVVEAGQPISLVGRTGRATTEHLHFEIRVASQYFDPEMVIDTDNRTVRSGKLYFLLKKDGTVAVSRNESSGGSGAATAGIAGSGTAGGTGSVAAENIVVNVVPAQQAAQREQSGAATYHKIKSGDTLSQIARKYSTTVAKICSLNGISANKVLQIGQKVRVK